MIFIFHIILGFEVILSASRGEDGFMGYTTYEPGNMNLILTTPHGGFLNPSKQSNNDRWPSRKSLGCENAYGSCIWNHVCTTTSNRCRAGTLNDKNTLIIARDIADEIYSLIGERIKLIFV